MPKFLKAIALLLLICLPSLVKAQTSTITWTETYQTIDGFGASVGTNDGPGATLTSTQDALFFSTTSGVGFSLFRGSVPDSGVCTSISVACAGDYLDMQAAISYGARVWATPWSPPASMKSNGSIICNTGSGDASLNSGSYGAYATYLSNFISSLSSLEKINLFAVSVQNEPDYCPTTYDGATWSAQNFDTFIKSNLGPTLATNGQSSTLIIMPEASQWDNFTEEASTCMTDSACYAYVGINAWHDYDDASSISNPYSSLGKKFWETEVSAGSGFGPSLCGGCWDPSMADGLLWAGIIDNRIAVANANAWNFWWFIDYNGDNEGLIYSDGVTTSKRLFVMGNYSKFVRPGWLRIDATHAPTSGVTISAYKDPNSGNFAIVATNQNGSDTTMSFSFSGFSTASVTPWVTSGSLNLVQQTAVTVSGNGFTTTLPASSVTTFVGSSGTPPAAPVITNITAQ
jgi:glucuronoarabinoxylan endo-1,4-beta-xylanase